jgi:nickel-dependent lactate racemase
LIIGQGSTEQLLSAEQIGAIIERAAATLALQGKRVLILIPDGTRTMPMPLMFDLFQKILRPKAKAVDYLVALGTHPFMSDEQLSRLLGRKVADGMTGETRVFNHHWENPRNFAHVGTIPADAIAEITGGLLSEDVPVGLNRLILEYDQILICGPVFPHEVVGFSGGNKYFFPGIASPEIINYTHWLGALITSFRIIGVPDTPVRALIDRAAQLIPRPVACFALVVSHEGVAGLYFGEAREAWRAAVALSSKTHIVYVDRPFRRVLSVMPEMYRDLWTAAKGMYKVEPAVANGGEVVIYSPRLNEISYTHGKIIREIGYHCRDYFLKQWDAFKNYPHGILAHSTHLKGLGKYDAPARVETPRIQVTLATQIPESLCRRVNLGYLDPASIQIEEWQEQEKAGWHVVPRAGETLFRLKQDSPRSEQVAEAADSALAGAQTQS